MNELLIDSLSLNSIGLVILGLALFVTHFWNKRKLSRDTDIVVIDGISESLLSRLFKVKFLLIGIGFILAGIFWGVKDYERSVMAFNSKLLQETLTIVKSSKTQDEKREAIKIMEEVIPLTILEKQNKASIEEWYDTNKDLNVLNDNTSEPICVQLFTIYELLEFNGLSISNNLEKLDRVYNEFYKDYWSENEYRLKWERINTARERNIEAAKIAEIERVQKAAADRIENEIDEKYPEAQKTESGLRYIIQSIGSGSKPRPGQQVKVNYAGYLMDGTCFDTSDKELAQKNGVYDLGREPYEPIVVEIGPRGRVIKGWQEGLSLLNIGGKAKLIIPPYLGYGERGAGGVVPPNASLVFDLEIVEVAY